MTEDATFNVLKRIPIKDMLQKYHNLDDIVWNRMTDDESNKFFESYGWTESEFRHHWSRYLKEINK